MLESETVWLPDTVGLILFTELMEGQSDCLRNLDCKLRPHSHHDAGGSHTVPLHQCRLIWISFIHVMVGHACRLPFTFLT